MRSLGIFEYTGRSEAWVPCIWPSRFTPVGLGFKGLEMAMLWGAEASNGYTIYRDVCKVQVRSLEITSIQGAVKANGY